MPIGSHIICSYVCTTVGHSKAQWLPQRLYSPWALIIYKVEFYRKKKKTVFSLRHLTWNSKNIFLFQDQGFSLHMRPNILLGNSLCPRYKWYLGTNEMPNKQQKFFEQCLNINLSFIPKNVVNCFHSFV